MNDLILNDFPLYWFFDSSSDLIRRDKVLDIISLAINRCETAEEIKTLINIAVDVINLPKGE